MENQADLTLYDYQDRLDWVKGLDWPEAKLRQVPIHLEQVFDRPFLSLPLGNLRRETTLDGLYVYQDEVPADVWHVLVEAVGQAGRSGYAHQGMFGAEGEDGSIPRPY